MDQTILNPELLKKSALLSGLPDQQLDLLVKNGECLFLEAGKILITENQFQDALYVILDGDFEILKRVGDTNVVLAIQSCGQILGEMSLIANVPPTATVRALCRSQVLKISREIFERNILGNPTVAQVLLRTVMLRLRNTEAMLGQHQKMDSLATLTAGLAHELNNPAAAARRSAGQLRQTINDWLNSRSGLDALNLEPRLNEAVLNRLRDDIAEHDHLEMVQDPLDRSDRESEVENWLSEHGMQVAWECAPIFVSFGWNPDSLETWCAEFNNHEIPIILHWLATGYIVHNLLDEINQSTERVSEIVAAVKSYTYLDQAPRKVVDIHDGLENTLAILQHKFKPEITLLRDYDRSIPRVEVYASELNQVWTKLIDNALDAISNGGLLRLITRQQEGNVIVEIDDNGPGFPTSVLQHLFEPFVTTKEPGQGAGLGLHIAYNIIQKHHGQIEVDSQPGDTRVVVSLPMTNSQWNPI